MKDGSGIVATSTTTVNDNAWHHIAVTRDGSSSVQLYVDGQIEDSGTDSDNFANEATVIGNRGDNVSD